MPRPTPTLLLWCHRCGIFHELPLKKLPQPFKHLTQVVLVRGCNESFIVARNGKSATVSPPPDEAYLYDGKKRTWVHYTYH